MKARHKMENSVNLTIVKFTGAEINLALLLSID